MGSTVVNRIYKRYIFAFSFAPIAKEKKSQKCFHKFPKEKNIQIHHRSLSVCIINTQATTSTVLMSFYAEVRKHIMLTNNVLNNVIEPQTLLMTY